MSGPPSTRALALLALMTTLAVAPPAAGQADDRATTTSATPEWTPPEQIPGTLKVTVDASEAINALVHFKIREGHLQLFLDGASVVDRTERKPPKGLLVYVDQLPAGEHRLEARWDVTFRSATDRHHPMGSAPEELGFSVPQVGFASAVVTIQPHGVHEVTVLLRRKSAGGLQGDTWVEWVGTDGALDEPPPPLPGADPAP